MKKTICGLLLMLTVYATIVSCSNEDKKIDENAAIKNAVIGTTWEYLETHTHEQRQFESKDNTNWINKALRTCPSLVYTRRDSITEQFDTINLCKRAGHTDETHVRITINEEKCLLTKTVSVTNQIVHKKSNCVIYKFQEGHYLANNGYTYYGVDVYDYGIYQSPPSGTTILLPFDYDFTHVASVITYTSSVTSIEESRYYETMTCKFDGGVLYCSNDTEEWKCELNEDATRLTITQLKPSEGLSFTLKRR